MSGGRYGRGKAPERACMKVEDWPAGDRARWRASLVPGDLFDDDSGARANRRALSNLTVAKGYGRWLTFLAEQGWLDQDASPASRITPERVGVYVDRLRGLGNAPYTVLNRIHELHAAALVMAPSADWSFLKTLLARLRARRKPAKEKRSRMVMAEELLQLGLSLMQDKSGTARQRALACRDGLIIAFLALQPLRRANLAQLRLGETLQRHGDEWTIVIPREASKSGQPIEVLWPQGLVPALEAYLAVHRPVLMQLTGRCQAPIGHALWVTAHGSPLSEEQLYVMMTRRTQAAFGKAIHPHLARDIAVTTLACADPLHARAAAPLLGHTSLVTTERHYQQAHGLDAQRRYFAGLVLMRNSPPAAPLEENRKGKDE